MKFWKLLSVALVAAVVASGSAWAQDNKEKKPEKPRPTPEETMKKLDKDGDGALSHDEFLAPATKRPEIKDRLEARFKALDKNADGKVSLDELKAGAQRGQKKAK
jgi:hypothetical protein